MVLPLDASPTPVHAAGRNVASQSGVADEIGSAVLTDLDNAAGLIGGSASPGSATVSEAISTYRNHWMVGQTARLSTEIESAGINISGSAVHVYEADVAAEGAMTEPATPRSARGAEGPTEPRFPTVIDDPFEDYRTTLDSLDTND